MGNLEEVGNDFDVNGKLKFQGVGNYGEVDVTLVREDVLAFYTLRTFTLQVFEDIIFLHIWGNFN